MRKVTSVLLITGCFIFGYLPFKAYATSSFTKVPQNPILSPGPDSWDSIRAWQQAIFFDGYEYKMWYTGYNGSKFQIGFAKSSDGINWTKNNNPVVSRLLIDNKDANSPTVLF